MQAPVKEEGAISFLQPIGYQAEACGYCKDPATNKRTPNSRACYYAVSRNLSVEHYQLLVDRGWRRSGTILYKPDVLRHCCPHYTIRLPVSSFKPARDQRQAINRWNTFILGEDYIKEAARKYPITKEEKKRQKNAFDLINAVHGSEYGNVKHPPEPAHRFEVTLEPDKFTPEKYGLFENYQRNVHHENPSSISQGGFKRFLCDSPLQRTTRNVNGTPQPLGSFHQCYRLDGRLIAMGVLDLLPHCVSGVYFIYHSDFEKWSFGKLSALREATLALEGGYDYYYMGYYIHSCVKMRYKGDYKPQYVLDPETYQWDPLEGGLNQLLDSKPYVSMSRERRQQRVESLPLQGPEENPQAADELRMLNDIPLPLPGDAGAAVEAGMSLFDLKIPGVMTVEEVLEEVDLDQITIEVRGQFAKTEALMRWESGSVSEPGTVKGLIAELAACVGPAVANTMVVKLN